jgi:hypothetical protein
VIDVKELKNILKGLLRVELSQHWSGLDDVVSVAIYFDDELLTESQIQGCLAESRSYD